MVHQKADGVSTFAASKALINFFGGRNGERRCFFVVEWAQSQIVGATLFQLYESPYDIYDINSALYLLYGVL